MGLGASVMCNCLKNGLKIPKEFINFFEIDGAGYPSLTIDYSQNPGLHSLFDQWMANACPHPDMDLVVEGVSNWAGIRLFQNILNFHKGRFSTLAHEIPNTNGGITPSEKAMQMLVELDEFERLEDLGMRFVLVDWVTDEIIWSYIPQYQGEMILSGREKIRIGIDEVGFFIRDDQGNNLFRSTRFKQILKDREKNASDSLSDVEFVDENTGKNFTCRTAIGGKAIQWPDGRWQDSQGRCKFEYPEYFYTDVKNYEVNDFRHILEALKIICQASIETGNPIRWC